MTKILHYNIVCTRRLQPPWDDCTVRIQWFSRVHIVACKQICFSRYRFIDFEYKCLIILKNNLKQLKTCSLKQNKIKD